jgi:hypothetical protein
VLRDLRSPAVMHFRGDASAAQCAAGMSGLVLHVLVWLLRPEDRLAIGESDVYRVRFFARVRENVGQEGLSAEEITGSEGAQHGRDQSCPCINAAAEIGIEVP